MTEWKTYRAEDYCLTVTDGTHDSPKPQAEGRYLITSKHLKPSGIDFSSANKICEEEYQKIIQRSKVEQYDILFSMIGTVGNIHRVTIPIVDFAVKNMGIFKMGGDANKSLWMYYWLQSPIAQEYIQSRITGSTQGYLTLGNLRDFPVCVPLLEEQRRIAGILGAIDDKIENNRRINDNLEQQAQALYKQWFVDNRSDDWEEIKLGDIIEISKKSITPAQSENTIFEHYSLPAFDDGIQPVFEKGKYIKSSKFIVEQNMFLFSKLNPRIKRIWLPDIQTENAICSTEFIPYKPKDIAMFGFCYSIVNSDSFYEYVLSLTNGSTGSHQRFHPIDTLDYELMIPNNDYIAKFEELVMPIYRTIARNRMECKNLATLRDTLLPKLMNGEIKTE